MAERTTFYFTGAHALPAVMVAINGEAAALAVLAGGCATQLTVMRQKPAEVNLAAYPKVAIGGITAQNAPQLVAAGADAVAVLSDLFDAPDVAARAREYAKVFAHGIA